MIGFWPEVIMLLCTGGARSGKSEFARQWVEAQGALRVYIATAYAADDDEMLRRIQRHQRMRGAGWMTLEAASGSWAEPETLVAEAAVLGDALLFDCLTLWTSLCLERCGDEETVLALTASLLDAFRRCGRPVALVANELGMGLVPEHPLGRRFRDIAGLVNQKAAAAADTAVFMVSGLPLYVKGNPPRAM